MNDMTALPPGSVSPARQVEIDVGCHTFQKDGWHVYCLSIGITSAGKAQSGDTYHVSEQAGLFVVADGIGSMPGGNESSGQCVRYLDNYLCEELEDLQPSASSPGDGYAEAHAEALHKALRQTNGRLLAEAKQIEHSASIYAGSCIAGLAVLPAEHATALVFHAGDARIYRSGADGTRRLTEDHSDPAWLAKQPRLANARTVRRPPVTKAIGVKPTFRPEVAVLPLGDTETFVLCTDGLAQYAESADMDRLMDRYAEGRPEDIDALVRLLRSQAPSDDATMLFATVRSVRT